MKKDTEIFNECRNWFLGYYENEEGFKYMFGGGDGMALKQILKKINKIKKEGECTLSTFKIMIEKLPKWYRENSFDLKTINSKFNPIIKQIRDDNGGSKIKYSNNFKENLYRDLQSE